ncbi:MAG: radical SAM protein, partial [Sandaracinaceae bacterium]|nr:radical SAM protein [Sandaracinaceae bacterium]
MRKQTSAISSVRNPGEPQRLTLHLTDRCNLNCRHCLRDPGAQPKDLPLSLIERLLDEIKCYSKEAVVVLTGGEPFLHPE